MYKYQGIGHTDNRCKIDKTIGVWYNKDRT